MNAMERNVLHISRFEVHIMNVSETVSEIKEAADGILRSAGQELNQARHDTADALHTAASSVRTTGCRGADAIDKVAVGAADKLDAAASYVQEHGLGSTITSIRRFGRRHPTTTLVVGLALGMVAGSLFTRISLGRED
jgi:ElaB/YqjD/DUF883 family membrane-anchored ribosome-binding protein